MTLCLEHEEAIKSTLQFHHREHSAFPNLIDIYIIMPMNILTESTSLALIAASLKEKKEKHRLSSVQTYKFICFTLGIVMI